jgi:hypothetical protein
MKDGKTLTDEHCFPHDVSCMEKLGYSANDITSVERLVRGKHLTIKKSGFIDTFFVATEEGIDVKMGGKSQQRAVVTKRMVGCYIKDTEPPLQVRLIMDPRTHDTRLELMRVKVKTLKGINARAIKPKRRGQLEMAAIRELVGNTYSILQSPDIDKCFTTPTGLSCFLKKPAIRAEILVRSQNVLLGFTGKGEKLKAIPP